MIAMTLTLAMALVAVAPNAPAKPTKEELSQRAAIERKRTLELRRELKRDRAAEKRAALPPPTLQERKRDPRWMALVERIQAEMPPHIAVSADHVPTGRVDSVTTRAHADSAILRNSQLNAPTSYEVFFKDGSRETYNGRGLLSRRTPVTK